MGSLRTVPIYFYCANVLHISGLSEKLGFLKDGSRYIKDYYSAYVYEERRDLKKAVEIQLKRKYRTLLCILKLLELLFLNYLLLPTIFFLLFSVVVGKVMRVITTLRARLGKLYCSSEAVFVVSDSEIRWHSVAMLTVLEHSPLERVP